MRIHKHSAGLTERSPRIVAGREHPDDDAVIRQQRKAKTVSKRIEQIACLDSHAKGCRNLRQEAVQKQNTVKQSVAHQ